MSDESIASKNDPSLITFRDHVWDYFELHAEQRLRMFHFFIILETGLVGGALLAARLGGASNRLLLMVGVLMVLFSFVFWKLDQRTKEMIKVSEEALKGFEKRLSILMNDESLTKYSPFTNDPQALGQLKALRGRFSYSKCFVVVFLAFAALGILIGFAPDLLASNSGGQIQAIHQ